MSFFSNLRADRLITEIRASTDPASPATQKAVARLKEVGPSAIEAVFAALPEADKSTTMALVDVLSSLVSQKTFPQFLRGLVEGSPRVVSGISWALTSSRNYPPHLLLEALATPGISRSAVLEVIAAQKSRFSVRELLAAAYTQEPNEKAALFRIIADIADRQSLPELIGRVQGKDPIARVHIINTLARFNTPEVQAALQGLLKDPNKLIRGATLAALQRMDGPIDIERVAALLRDPEIDVLNRAIDVVIKANHPETIKYLIEVLKDENENARRAAVEVLNEIGNANSVKYLLASLKDSDWWVRSRAADALGKIGGPKVIDAVLQLVRDKDEDIRRAAIEILNQTKDERAVDSLIQATRDNDWWVSERAVDALAEIGSKRALPRLMEMLQAPANPKAAPIVVRALGKLGDGKLVDMLLPLIARPEREIRIEAMHALSKVTDEARADQVRNELQAQVASPDQTISRMAAAAVTELDNRIAGITALGASATPLPPAGTAASAVAAAAAGVRPPQPTQTEGAKTVLISEQALAQSAKQAEVAARLDIQTLKPGDVIEGRYKYIDRIGRGAFGTVLLMEDTVVDERLILKFLNPNVSQDEEVMKRFVHELRYSRKITHKNVIRIYDFLYIQGLYAISMEYFPSHTLGGEVVNEKPVELKRGVQFGIDICTGMTVAHQVGIVHRDLKPANVLINQEGLLKIVDFGVAAAQREGDTQLTKTGYVIGSPKYMAPEQILGKKVDQRADIYALGVILYEVLTGVPPYTRGDHMSVMYQHVQGKARAAKDVNPALPQELSDVVMRAMAVDKNKRFQTMTELSAALEPFVR
ncbi:MAG TPA: HEAT repeat domain-containing protein [Steroidobacteraceae bacterium]|jgi:HEAT repeat protein/tRNA A-37 threonylcarbamoyl transferase component Bud32|nr:HEAT repeat domain-containing protein [Steroidobacteraceae bacterium]